MSFASTIHGATRLTVLSVLVAALASVPPAHGASATFGQFDRDDVLLVVAPHPDDETLCCAGAMQRARAAGARVAVVWITSGDGYELAASLARHRLFSGAQELRAFGEMRMQEAARATTVLGLAPSDRFFLGYPDGGIEELLHAHHDARFRSPHTHADAVPYAQALRPAAAYSGANLEQDLRAVFDRVQPTWVLAPTPLDTHPDHSATGEFILGVMKARGTLERARLWIVHGGFLWPWPRGLHMDAALVAPRRARELAWQDFALPPPDRNVKVRAIRAYETQLLLGESFLLAFARRNEIYSSVPAETGVLK